jgi:hypothetical protein
VINFKKQTWKRYGGTVINLDVTENRGIITSDNGTADPGCIEVPLKPQSNFDVVRRSMAVYLALGRAAIEDGLADLTALSRYSKGGLASGGASACSCLSCNETDCCVFGGHQACMCETHTWEPVNGSCDPPPDDSVCSCGGRAAADAVARQSPFSIYFKQRLRFLANTK